MQPLEAAAESKRQHDQRFHHDADQREAGLRDGVIRGFLVLGMDWADTEHLHHSYDLIARYVMPHFQGNLASMAMYAHDYDDAVVPGETYLPEAVLVRTQAGLWRPALCYLCPAMVPRPADGDYVERIVTPAREFGFPEWYLARLESFRA